MAIDVGNKGVADAGGILENTSVHSVRFSLVVWHQLTQDHFFFYHTFKAEFRFVEHLVIVCLALHFASWTSFGSLWFSFGNNCGG